MADVLPVLIRTGAVALGSTVAVIVLAALAVTELTPLASGDDPGHAPAP